AADDDVFGVERVLKRDRRFGDALFPAIDVRLHRSPVDAFFDSFLAVQQDMAESERDNRAVEDEGAANARADTEVEHPTAFVAAEGLHTGIVHDANGALEGRSVVEADPTVAEVPGLGDRLAMDHVARVAD